MSTHQQLASKSDFRICTVCKKNHTPLDPNGKFYPECTLCHKMKAGMSVASFVQICCRIDIYQRLKRKNRALANEVVKLMDRPRHPLCKKMGLQNCVAKNPTYSRFMGDIKEKGGNLSETQWTKMVFKSSCESCGIYPAHGVDRKDPGKGYTQSNSEPYCTLCNLMKNDLPKNTFMKHASQFRREHTEVFLKHYT